MQIQNIERHRGNTPCLTCSTKYFVKNQRRELIPVCVDAFVNLLHMSQFRLNNTAKQYHTTGYAEDRTGGFRMAEKYTKTEGRHQQVHFQITIPGIALLSRKDKKTNEFIYQLH